MLYFILSRLTKCVQRKKILNKDGRELLVHLGGGELVSLFKKVIHQPMWRGDDVYYIGLSLFFMV